MFIPTLLYNISIALPQQVLQHKVVGLYDAEVINRGNVGGCFISGRLEQNGFSLRCKNMTNRL